MQTNQLQKKPNRETITKVIFTTVMVLALVIWSYPVLLTIITSLKTDAQVINSPLGLPTEPNIKAFLQVWDLLDFGVLLRNSIIYSVGGTALSVLFAIVPAYALSRFRIPGGEVVFVILLTGMMVPQQTVIIPLYEVLRNLELLNKIQGLILVHAVYGLPFVLLILRGFMVNIPGELESAARVDGCNDFQILRFLIVPLSIPAILVAFTLNAINIWRELFFALIFLNNESYYPLTVGLIKVTQSQYFSSWNIPAAAVILAQLPMVILYIFAYRWIQKGMFAGAIKG